MTCMESFLASSLKISISVTPGLGELGRYEAKFLVVTFLFTIIIENSVPGEHSNDVRSLVSELYNLV